jgi:hypothetical protein
MESEWIVDRQAFRPLRFVPICVLDSFLSSSQIVTMMPSYKLVPCSPSNLNSGEDINQFSSFSLTGMPQPKRVSICGVHEISPPAEDRIFTPTNGIARRTPTSFGNVMIPSSVAGAHQGMARPSVSRIAILSPSLVDRQVFYGKRNTGFDSGIVHLDHSQMTAPFLPSIDNGNNDDVPLSQPPQCVTRDGNEWNSSFTPRSLYNEEAVSLLLGMRNSPYINSSTTPKTFPANRMLPFKKRSLSCSDPGTGVVPARRAPRPTLSPAKVDPQSLRLAMPDDAQKLNSLHCYVRSELLEVFVSDDFADPRALHKLKLRSGRVGLRCVHCAHLTRKERADATMSRFFPKSLNDIYRGVCTWQRIHFASCQQVPKDVAEEYRKLKNEDRSRGKKSYWVHGALQLGLRNVDDNRNGIVWCEPM